jgi:hypothetical protein
MLLVGLRKCYMVSKKVSYGDHDMVAKLYQYAKKGGVIYLPALDMAT